jgi:hypothetical protein
MSFKWIANDHYIVRPAWFRARRTASAGLAAVERIGLSE